MPTLYQRTSTAFILAAILFGFLNFSYSQSQQNAAAWKTYILNVNEAKFTAPPSANQEEKELGAVKARLANNNERTMRQIKYWNAGSPAYRWNEMASRIVQLKNPEIFFRAPLAWINIAIYDATIAAWKAKYQYQRKRPSQIDPSLKPLIELPATPSYPCEHAVTAAAAAHVLAYFYPSLADSIMKLATEAAESRINAGVQFPSDIEAGWKLGEQVALKVIDQAKRDGSAEKWTGQMNTDPTKWRGTYPVGITTSKFKPLVLKSGDQFRPPPPPDFANDMSEMKNFKNDFNSSHAAFRWAYLTGLDIWTQIASQKMFEYKLDDDAPLCARIYATASVAVHDALIAVMDAKYTYWGIRPAQYDTTYTPLIRTPPNPGYPSGHATVSSTSAAVLGYFFPADADYFNQLAKECADSRFYAGIHFQSDNKAGLELGKAIGNYVVRTREK